MKIAPFPGILKVINTAKHIPSKTLEVEIPG